MDAAAISKRLADLREEQNTSPKSSDLSPTPLHTYLMLYTRARQECYIDYMEGAKFLYNWLAPIEVPELEPMHFPDLLISHELTELAKVLSRYDLNKDLVKLRKVETAILYILFSENYCDQSNYR